jgi:hypothetical protein
MRNEVALAKAESYEQNIIRQKVEQMFENIGGLRDIITQFARSISFDLFSVQ